MLSFGVPMSSTQRHKTVFLPCSVGCQRSRTFLAPNPEQTVPFDVDDVRRTEDGRSLPGEMSAGAPPPFPWGDIMQYFVTISAIKQVVVYQAKSGFHPLCSNKELLNE